MKDLLNSIEQKWSAIKTAWIPITMLLVAAMGAVYVATSRLDKGTNDALAERLKLRDDQNAELRAKVGTDSPTEIRKRLSNLEERLAKSSPRRLTEEVKKRLADLLKESHGIVKMDYDAAVSDSGLLIADLAQAFSEAGWTVVHEFFAGNPHPAASGVGLVVRNPSSLTHPQSVIAKALRTAGIAFDLQSGPLIRPIGIDCSWNFAGTARCRADAEIVVSQIAKSDPRSPRSP